MLQLTIKCEFGTIVAINMPVQEGNNLKMLCTVDGINLLVHTSIDDIILFYPMVLSFYGKI